MIILRTFREIEFINVYFYIFEKYIRQYIRYI